MSELGTTCEPQSCKIEKVFISQAMRGLTVEEIRSQRAAAEEAIIKDYGEVEFLGTEPKETPFPPADNKTIAQARIEALSDSLKILAKADLLVLIKPQGKLPDGCFIETSVAKRYGIYVRTWRPEFKSGWEEFG
ncbi:MAG: hypothetical protein FWB90_00610 [Fibromonadales bacterium]|nr:hypothetical protein [Fibromonadales bacterium]